MNSVDFLTTCHSQQYETTDHCTKMFLWQICHQQQCNILRSSHTVPDLLSNIMQI